MTTEHTYEKISAGISVIPETDTIPVGAKEDPGDGIPAPSSAREIKIIFPAIFTGGNCEIRESLDGGTVWNTVNMPGAANDTDKRKITSAAAAGETVNVGFMLLPVQPTSEDQSYTAVRYKIRADTNQVVAAAIKWHFWSGQ